MTSCVDNDANELTNDRWMMQLNLEQNFGDAGFHMFHEMPYMYLYTYCRKIPDNTFDQTFSVQCTYRVNFLS